MIKKTTKEIINRIDNKINKKIENRQNNQYKIGVLTNKETRREKIITGKILHLDGDKKYSQKSYYYYKKLGLNAIVRNIPEYKQPKVVYSLLTIYKPDILVITRT